jgi:hypothetical protein
MRAGRRRRASPRLLERRTLKRLEEVGPRSTLAGHGLSISGGQAGPRRLRRRRGKSAKTSARCHSPTLAIGCAVQGLTGVPVTVEVDVANGLPSC